MFEVPDNYSRFEIYDREINKKDDYDAFEDNYEECEDFVDFEEEG